MGRQPYLLLLLRECTYKGGLALALRQANGTTIEVAITRGVQWIENSAFSTLMAAVSAVGYAPWSWLVLGCAIVALVVMVGFVGVPRIRLGHHWASDVLVGYPLDTAYRLLVIGPKSARTLSHSE